MKTSALRWLLIYQEVTHERKTTSADPKKMPCDCHAVALSPVGMTA